MESGWMTFHRGDHPVILLMATRNPANSPVEVGRILPLFTGFYIHVRLVVWEF